MIVFDWLTAAGVVSALASAIGIGIVARRGHPRENAGRSRIQ